MIADASSLLGASIPFSERLQHCNEESDMTKTQTPLGVAALLPKKPNGPVQLLKLSELSEDPENARQTYDRNQLQQLADSIKAQGLLQPITVRPAPGGGGRYIIVSGSRRFRAHQLVGLKEIPALVREDLIETNSAIVALAENLQRVDLTPYEEARAYKAALEADKKLNVARLAHFAGVAHNTVKARLQWLDYPEDLAREAGRSGFTQAHAKILAPIAKDPKALKIALAAIRDYRAPMSHEVQDIVPADRCAGLIKDALVKEGLFVDAERAGRKHDGVSSSAHTADIKKAAAKVGGFELGHFVLAPATPDAKAVLKELRGPVVKGKSGAEKAKQALQQKRQEKAALEHEANSQLARQLQAEAIRKKAATLELADAALLVLLEAAGNYVHRSKAIEIYGLAIKPDGPMVGGKEILSAIEKLPEKDRLEAVFRIYLFAKLDDYQGRKTVDDILGQSFEDFLNQAAAQRKAAVKASEKETKQVQSDSNKAEAELAKPKAAAKKPAKAKQSPKDKAAAKTAKAPKQGRLQPDDEDDVLVVAASDAEERDAKAAEAAELEDLEAAGQQLDLVEQLPMEDGAVEL